MNEGAGSRRLIAEVVDVRHHIMAKPASSPRRFLEAGVVQVRAKLIHCGIRDRDSQILLALHERQPQPAPQADTAAFAPERLHRGRGVACGERRDPAQTAAFARATSLLPSARKWSMARAVSGWSRSFFRTSGGNVASAGPMIA